MDTKAVSDALINASRTDKVYVYDGRKDETILHGRDDAVLMAERKIIA